jgi:hypothetical protein
LILGVIVAISLANEYGWGGIGGVFSGALTIVGAAAVPALAGWLVLRIARKADARTPLLP